MGRELVTGLVLEFPRRTAEASSGSSCPLHRVTKDRNARGRIEQGFPAPPRLRVFVVVRRPAGQQFSPVRREGSPAQMERATSHRQIARTLRWNARHPACARKGRKTACSQYIVITS